MNRRRRFGSTILLSSLAALAVVGTGLAVGGTLLAEGSQDFNVTFTDNTKPEMGKVVVSEELKSTTLDVVFDDAGGTVAFSNDIVFEYTPAEGTNLDGKVLSLDYTATFTPDAFLTYFDVANDEGTLAVDPVATTADGVYTFTLKKDALGITLKAEQTYKAAKEALEGQAKVNLAFQVTADDEEVPPEPVEPVVTEVKLDADALTLTAGGEAKTLTATVTVDQGEAPIVNWTIPENDSITVTGEDTNTLTITPVKAGAVDITATAGEKSAKATITVEEAVDPTPEYTSLTDAKKAEDGDWLTVRGEVTAVAGNSAYITDGQVGLYIYNFMDAKPNWQLGKEYVIHGQVDVYNGLIQLSGFGTSGDTPTVELSEEDLITPPSAIPLDEEGYAALTATDAGNMYTFEAEYVSGTPSTKTAVSTKWMLGETEITLRTDKYDEVGISETLTKGATYTITTPLSWFNGAQFAFLGQGTTLVKKVVELTSIEITGSNEVAVDSTITLTANPNAGAELGEVTWTSSDTDVATVENGVVTGLTEGTTQITAKSGEVTSDSFQVTVVTATTTEGLVADYSSNLLSPMSGSKYSSKLDTSSVIDALNSGGADIAVSASTAENVYKDNEYTGIKFSSTKNSGKLTFTTTQSFSKVVIKAIAWLNDSPSILVNGTNFVFVNNDGATVEEATFSFDTESTELTISATDRLVVAGITLY